ncbi:hypothetical protein [Desulfocurvibacter africanus]|uniref:hypothetical protein n=1 Tax=Desulfocurvibacter africanus TaxID=873 RepID=UPI0003F4D492|nr:hypothetical protein [Desulfocurvibacter africanus]
MRRLAQIITALALPIPVLACCEVLLQWHGWTFWSAYFDQVAGPGLSVTLAVLAASWWAVSAWSRSWAARLGYGLLAMVASLVLLAGPLYQVSSPIVQAHEAAKALPGRLANLDAAIDARRAELDKYLAITASGRYGWHGRIDDARTALADLEARRAALVDSAPESVSGQRLAAAGLQAVALILLQIGAASMAALAGRRLRAVREVATVSPATSEIRAEAQAVVSAESVEATAEEAVEALVESVATIEAVEAAEPEALKHEANHSDETSIQPAFKPDEVTIRRLQREMTERISQAGSARKFCDAEGVNQRDVSWLRNHFDRLKRGEPTVSDAKIQELAGRFLSPTKMQAAGGQL